MRKYLFKEIHVFFFNCHAGCLKVKQLRWYQENGRSHYRYVMVNNSKSKYNVIKNKTYKKLG